ncbi:unnamed protein product [Cyprideis torosa]|uniref:Uncharacterized protein n=1 Tax=Cyprideis torosa TaxID=163714 RepID=A0A7R8W5U5_9CRUS|nr:unnamed protein product [Cyprideis torosa]CAG0885687.1 unnamed protein product [Cyprideis torosa]
MRYCGDQEVISLGADGQGVASSARTALTSSPSEEFFQNYVLRISGGIESYGSFVWPLGLAVVVTWFVVFLCIIRGVRSVGKVVYFTATFPYVMLLALLIRGATLPGAADGIKYYIYPDWPKLKDPKVWVDAAIQIFYSLGPGWGGLITMASYNKFQNNIKRDSIIVPILNCGTSIFAGFVVFSVLGFMAHTMGVPVAEVATQGPSLAFVTYPQAVALMPFSSVWAVMFFFMLITLGLDTVFVEVETMLACILDDYPRCRPYRFWINVGCCSFLCACSLVFCFEGGIYLLTILDYYSSGIPIVLVCLLETIVIMYIYGMNKFNRDIQFMVGERLNPVWRFLWGFCTPLALVAILVAFVSNTPRATYGLYAFPDWAIALGWTTGAIAILLIPGYVVYAIWASKGTVKERATSLLFADASYGPAQKCDWEAWHAHCLKQEQIGIFKWMSQRLNWLLRRRR